MPVLSRSATASDPTADEDRSAPRGSTGRCDSHGFMRWRIQEPAVTKRDYWRSANGRIRLRDERYCDFCVSSMIHKRLCESYFRFCDPQTALCRADDSQTPCPPNGGASGGEREKARRIRPHEPAHREPLRDRIQRASGAPCPRLRGRGTASYDRALRFVFAAVTGKMDVRAFSHRETA